METNAVLQTQVASSAPASSIMLPKELLELFREDDLNASGPSSNWGTNWGTDGVCGPKDEVGDEESGDELYGEDDGDGL